MSATALVISNMIGQGIFTATGYLAADLGSAKLILLIWVVGALCALAGAFCYSELGVNFPILSDFWPHGEVAKAYGSFNDTFGVTMRWSFVLDKDGVVREIIKTDALPEAREHAAYQKALSAI